jgi:hypothetical protein
MPDEGWRHSGCPGNGAMKNPVLLIKAVEAQGVPHFRATRLSERQAAAVGGAGNGALTD